jgi:hypothetical protein
MNQRRNRRRSSHGCWQSRRKGNLSTPSHDRIIWGMNDMPLTGRSSPHRHEQRNHYRCVMMALTMEAVRTSETSVCFYETTSRHVPEYPHPCLDLRTLLNVGTSSEQSLHLDFERTWICACKFSDDNGTNFAFLLLEYRNNMFLAMRSLSLKGRNL